MIKQSTIYQFPSNEKGITILEMILALGLMGLVALGVSYLFNANSRSSQDITSITDAQSQIRIANAQIKSDLINAGGGMPPGSFPFISISEQSLGIRYLDRLKKYCPSVDTLEIIYRVNPVTNNWNEYGTDLFIEKRCNDSLIFGPTSALNVPEGIRLRFRYFDEDNVEVLSDTNLAHVVKISMDIGVRNHTLTGAVPTENLVSSVVKLNNM